jgi:ethanolaminephosphotransferase
MLFVHEDRRDVPHVHSNRDGVKISRHKIKLLIVWTVLAVAQISAIYLFYRSFFKQKTIPSEKQYRQTWELFKNHSKTHLVVDDANSPFLRVIFMVIDAMRADLMFEKEGMKFTRSNIFESKNGYIAHAHPPTVTLPRLRALMSGSMPVFLDILNNLIPSEADEKQTTNEDSLLHKFREANKTVTILGDETWMRLYKSFGPKSFTNSDVVTSFFVTDTVQVDLNVSRHLDSLPTDFGFLALHYLGLDHLGHIGASSSMVEAKLEEMDQVVQKLWKTLDDDTLLVVCSDHGMTDSGNHGGASRAETETVLSLLSPRYTSFYSDWKRKQVNRVNQIDLVPTLSTLLGLPIPRHNIGKLITSAFEPFEDVLLGGLASNADQILNTYLCNFDAKQIVEMINSNDSFIRDYERLQENHVRFQQGKFEKQELVDQYNKVRSIS